MKTKRLFQLFIVLVLMFSSVGNVQANSERALAPQEGQRVDAGPHHPQVRAALLVRAAVGALQLDQSVPAVEPPCRTVAHEHPEGEAVRPERLDQVEQRRTGGSRPRYGTVRPEVLSSGTVSDSQLRSVAGRGDVVSRRSAVR